MKLIIEHIDTDEGTYSYATVTPVIYSSQEQLIVDLEEWAEENKHKIFFFAGGGFLGSNITPEPILKGRYEIFTLEEWFENEAVGNE